MFWFNFVLGSIIISLCFIFIIIHYHTQTKENKNWTTTYTPSLLYMGDPWAGNFWSVSFHKFQLMFRNVPPSLKFQGAASASSTSFTSSVGTWAERGNKIWNYVLMLDTLKQIDLPFTAILENVTLIAKLTLEFWRKNMSEF